MHQAPLLPDFGTHRIWLRTKLLNILSLCTLLVRDLHRRSPAIALSRFLSTSCNPCAIQKNGNVIIISCVMS